MKKYILDLRVKSVEKVGGRYSLLKLTHEQPLPEMVPGQQDPMAAVMEQQEEREIREVHKPLMIF